MDADVVARYLARVGLDGSDTSLPTLMRAHVTHIPYENLDVRLGREIRLDVASLVAKMVDRKRGGYCFEQNTLFAAVLEGLGYSVIRGLGRVRMAYGDGPRPATHMVLLVDGLLLDVGFGSANPLGPIPLGGDATYGPYTWWTERTVSAEGEDAWAVRFFDMTLYTFTETPQHPVDYIAPNHFTSTHPSTIFTQHTIVQHWEADEVQFGVVNREATQRNTDGSVDVTTLGPGDLGALYRERFDLELDDDEIARLVAQLVAPT